MAFSRLWTLAAVVLLLGVIKVKSNPPVPVLNLQENVFEGEDTTITCTLPCTNCLDVDLTIKGNVTFKSCNSMNGNDPNVTCTVEVTEEMNEKEFTCEAQFKTKSLPKKMIIKKNPGSNTGNRSKRTEPVSATILAMLMASSFMYYLC